VFSYYKSFASDEKVKEVEHWCKNAQKGCAECKKEMANILIEYLKPYREKRKWLEEKRQERVIEPWGACLSKIRKEAISTVKEVKNSLYIYDVQG